MVKSQPTPTQIYDFIRRFIAASDEAPTFGEISARFHVSTAFVLKVLATLERDGLITRAPRSKRGIKIVDQSNGGAATAK